MILPRQTAPETAPVLDTRPLVGPLYIGSVLTWLLMGTLTAQVYWYSQQFRNDKRSIKIIVYGIFSLDVLQTIISTWATWALLIDRWGDITVLLFPPRVAVATAIFSAVIGALVQTFYAWRIWTIGNHLLFSVTAGVIVLIALVQSLACIVDSIRFAIVSVSAELPRYRAGFTVWLAGSFACDVIIAASMLVILNKARNREFHRNLDSALDRLIRQTVETGAVTAVCAGVELILFLKFPLRNDHIAPAYVLGKLYTNCLVATLNARRPSNNNIISGTSSSSKSGSRHICTCGNSSATVEASAQSASRRRQPNSANKQVPTSPRSAESFQLASLTGSRSGRFSPIARDGHEKRPGSATLESDRTMQVEITRETMISSDVTLSRDDMKDGRTNGEPSSDSESYISHKDTRVV